MHQEMQLVNPLVYVPMPEIPRLVIKHLLNGIQPVLRAVVHGGLVDPREEALLKALYLATHEIAKKWTMPLRNWGKVLGELEIMYPDRLN